MITLSIAEKITDKKIKILKEIKYIKCFKSVDEARSFIKPIVIEMKRAKKEKRDPKIRIDAVSWDTPSEKTMLLEIDAITSIENESQDNM